MTSAEHTKFRTTTRWRKFRIQLLEERGYKCQCCGIKKKKGLQIHHKRPDKYTDLDIHEDFVVLCSDCHDLVEKFAKRFRGKKKNTITNANLWFTLLSPFFSIEPETKDGLVYYQEEIPCTQPLPAPIAKKRRRSRSL